MELGTKEYFRKLKGILKKSGLIAMLDYDLQITRFQNKGFNYACAMLFGDLILKKPYAGHIFSRGDSTYFSTYYTATFNSFGVLKELKLATE